MDGRSGLKIGSKTSWIFTATSWQYLQIKLNQITKSSRIDIILFSQHPKAPIDGRSSGWRCFSPPLQHTAKAKCLSIQWPLPTQALWKKKEHGEPPSAVGQTISSHYLNWHSNLGSSTKNGSMTQGVGTSQEWSKNGHGQPGCQGESCWEIFKMRWLCIMGKQIVWFALSWQIDSWFFHDIHVVDLQCFLNCHHRYWDLSLGRVKGNVDGGDHVIFTYFTTKHVHSNTTPKVRIY